MEDVLSVYTRPHDPDRPLVCVDETSKQLIAETRVPIPMKPGRPARSGVDRMLVILGASGSGKSSFFRAGLWPRLKRDDELGCRCQPSGRSAR
jgi:ABC-type uncharacterized transport system fused permease/ATPase subunit